MWLLPCLPRLSRGIAGLMHRISAVEGSIPSEGPVLLVANHPNALIDPVVVTAAVRRPVRWLGKSTLVFHPLIGWLFRAVGTIPVYRRQDDATQVGRNAEAFTAAVDALRHGSVVALFPEGISHAAPSLAPLKTGAARLALQAMAPQGATIPIIPVGVIYRDAGTFRSPAGVVIGQPIAWEDLVARGAEDRDAVTLLTDRIGTALRNVTRQLDSWADQPVVELAASVVAAESPAGITPPSWIARASGTHGALARAGHPLLPSLKERLQRHGTLLRRLRVTPAQLAGRARTDRSHWWSGWRAPLVAMVWLLGIAWTWLPYRATGPIANRLTDHTDLHSTLKAVIGFLLFLVWIVATAVGIGLIGGWHWGAIALPLLVALALVTLPLEEARLARRALERTAHARKRRTQEFTALEQDQRQLADDLRQLLDSKTA